MGDEQADTTPAATGQQSEDDSKADAGTGTGESSSTSEPAVMSDEKRTPQATEQAKKSPGNPSSGKVKIHFVAVGSAPLMKKTKFAIGSDQRFSSVVAFLRRMLKLGNTGSSLFLYVNSAFVPSPDELVGDLNECFSVRGELVVHYSLQEAWG